MKKEINYYGNEADYIHLKFGDCRKNYNFTEEFIAQYPLFAREYSKYFEGSREKTYDRAFNSPFAIVEYVYKHKIPVHFYYNFTDTPAKNKKEIIDYLVSENSYSPELK
jgi:hypothetical protein